MGEFFLENPIPQALFKEDSVFSNSSIITFTHGGNAFSITDAEWAVFVGLLQERELDSPNKDLSQSVPLALRTSAWRQER